MLFSLLSELCHFSQAWQSLFCRHSIPEQRQGCAPAPPSSNIFPAQLPATSSQLLLDLLILEKVVPCLKFKTLSSSGFLSETELMVLATEFQRGRSSVKYRWEHSLQPWLLQHHTGTSSFKIEKMLASVVAEKFTDIQGIGWSDLVKQHKELSGHTGSSLSSVYRKVISCMKHREGYKEVNPFEIARYAAEAYQPAKEPVVKVVRRERIIQHFEDRVKLLEIDVVV